VRFIRDIYARARAANRPVLSFELFTPRTGEAERALFEKTLPALARLQPGFCSVTYGAGGSTRRQTLLLVDRLQRELSLPGMAHLTCVESTRQQIEALLAEAKALGIKNILALRGDPPAGAPAFVPPAGGFQYAYELVKVTREVGGFSIGVAGFPEGHLECKEGKHVDWARLKAKIDCGADFVITQMFFDNDYFHEFREHLTGRLGVTAPIIPGVIPILSAGQIAKFTALCGATVPDSLRARLAQLAGDDAAVSEFGIEFATQQCADLLRHGVPGLHFYTLNRARPSTRIVQNLGLAGPP
jgi:methylenetetrahydrofolate reductase (NADPH)